MTVTSEYGIAAASFRETALDWQLTPFHVRLLVALFEHGPAGSDRLESLLGDSGSGTRRALGVVYRRGMAEGFAEDGGPRRAGMRSRVTITDRGELVARDALKRVQIAREAA